VGRSVCRMIRCCHGSTYQHLGIPSHEGTEFRKLQCCLHHLTPDKFQAFGASRQPHSTSRNQHLSPNE